jgi:hypothetical protein
MLECRGDELGSNTNTVLDSCLGLLDELEIIGVTYMSVREPHLQSFPIIRPFRTAYAHRRSLA